MTGTDWQGVRTEASPSTSTTTADDPARRHDHDRRRPAASSSAATTTTVDLALPGAADVTTTARPPSRRQIRRARQPPPRRHPAPAAPARPSWHSRPLGYIPALDGMRAVAVGLVIAYHLGYSGVAGGYIGVEVFFVLSGWLVCALLMNEHQRTGGIALAGFWLRRARRLLPAMVRRDRRHACSWRAWSTPGSARRAAHAGGRGRSAYHLNWRLIVDQQSYFEAADGPVGPRAPVVAVDRGAVLPGLPAAVRRSCSPGGPAVSAVRLVAGPGRSSSTVLRCVAVRRRAATRPGVYFGTDTRPVGPAARRRPRPVLDAQPPAAPRQPPVHR